MTDVDYSNVVLARAGVAYPWTVDIANVNPADLLAKGYLMLKTDVSVADGSASVSKSVTSSNVAGTGQIVKTAGGTGAVRFDIVAADTSGLAARDFIWAIKVVTAGGAAAYIASGLFRLAPAVITST